ncbi:MAG TPA: hypothetical protein VFC21_06810 [Bryobacteraceae bacterium]|nr:hypothetical protein [Bryobacteraceae bacterium]
MRADYRGEDVDTLVVGATLVGSLGTAWALQRAILSLCLKAIARR